MWRWISQKRYEIVIHSNNGILIRTYTCPILGLSATVELLVLNINRRLYRSRWRETFSAITYKLGNTGWFLCSYNNRLLYFLSFFVIFYGRNFTAASHICASFGINGWRLQKNRLLWVNWFVYGQRQCSSTSTAEAHAARAHGFTAGARVPAGRPLAPPLLCG